jgi:Kdo2-lipid IVA lauroyltransferase/acyltransferase
MALSIRHRIEALGVQMVSGVAARLPYGMLRVLGAGLGAMYWAADGHGRAVADANLRAAFGDTMDAAKRRQVARGSFATFARTVLEVFWSPNVTREVAARLVACEGLDLTPCNTQDGIAAIYPTMHFSNFEWVGLVGAYTLRPVPLVAQQFRNPLLGPVFDRLRSSSGHWVIPQERAMIRMLKHLRAGGKFGMLCDLCLDPAKGSVVIEQFGGLQTSVTQMHAALALRTGAQIVPVEFRPGTRSPYRMIYHRSLEFSPGSSPRRLAQMTWDSLEPSIREHPECWLWSYKHWRFKPSDGDTSRYPFYAHRAPRFDRRLAEG